jgi:drug/metabolite transporter superfamily protein YnfA
MFILRSAAPGSCGRACANIAAGCGSARASWALGVYGFVATFQPDAHFGRILAAYGGIFVAGSLAWGMVADGYRPDRWDVTGALICLAGMAVIMWAPRDH